MRPELHGSSCGNPPRATALDSALSTSNRIQVADNPENECGFHAVIAHRLTQSDGRMISENAVELGCFRKARKPREKFARNNR